MLFNVTKAVNFILDEKIYRYYRAIKLFELSVAIHLADGFPKKIITIASDDNSSSDVIVRVSKQKLHDARMLATVKLLEYISEPLKCKNGKVSTKLLAQDPDWCKLFDKQFVRFGGFRRARHVSAARKFDDDLRNAKQKAKKLAKVIEFSLRFKPDPRSQKKIGGITMARLIVSESKYLNVGCKERTLENYWPKFEPVVAFLPLIYLKKYPAWPLRVSTTKFADKLLSRLDDKNTLINFFAEYNANVLRLQGRGYKLQSLAGLPTAEVVFDALPKEVEVLVEAYTRL